MPAAVSCVDCPKRTGQQTVVLGYRRQVGSLHRSHLLPVESRGTRRQDHRGQAQPRANQHGLRPAERRQHHVPRNKYTEIRAEKPKDTTEAKRPEFKVCKFTTEAIVTDGSDVGTLRKVCTNPSCSVHHQRQRLTAARMRSGRPNRRSSAVNKPSQTHPDCAFSVPSPPLSRCGS